MADNPIDKHTGEENARKGVEGALLADVYKSVRKELVAYVTRLVIRRDVAEEIVQESAARWITASNVPADVDGARAWLFRVATNLAFDHRRRHSTWRENVLLETKDLAIRNAAFLKESRSLAGSPELKAIAREHLAVCFACTLRNVPEQHGAALLLAEVNGFSLEETSKDSRPARDPGQTRASIRARIASEEIRQHLSADRQGRRVLPVRGTGAIFQRPRRGPSRRDFPRYRRTS